MVIANSNLTETTQRAMLAQNVSSHDAFHSCTSLMLQGLIEQLGWMFYYVKPNSSLFMSVDEVPNYEVQVRFNFYD